MDLKKNRKRWIWTGMCAVFIVIAVVMAPLYPGFEGLFVLVVSMSVAMLGTVWFYRLDRSAGVFTIAAMIFGYVVFYMTVRDADPLWFVVPAVVYGAIVALQPLLAGKLDEQFAKWDDRWNQRRSRQD